jgi:hypothetical protein
MLWQGSLFSQRLETKLEMRFFFFLNRSKVDFITLDLLFMRSGWFNIFKNMSMFLKHEFRFSQTLENWYFEYSDSYHIHDLKPVAWLTRHLAQEPQATSFSVTEQVALKVRCEVSVFINSVISKLWLDLTEPTHIFSES